MAKTARTYITYVTDPMTLVYPKFETPDVFTNKKTGAVGAPAYKTDAKDAAVGGGIAKAQAFVTAELLKLFPKMDPKTRRITLPNGDTKTLYWPFKTDADGVETLTAKTGRKNKAGELQRVPMFDAKNQKMPEGVYPGGGTVARLDLTLNAMPNDGGINFYINALQILKLEESSFGKSNFEPTEGYAYDGGSDEPKEATNNFATADEADATKF